MPGEKTTAAAGRKRRRSSPKAATATKKQATTTAKTTKATKAKSPSTSGPPLTPPPSRILLVDNGGDSIKYGWIESESNDTVPQSIPNMSARLMHQFTTLVGDELNRVQNPNSLMPPTRSMERGMICNLENQTRVWKRMLDLLGVMVPTHTVTAKCLGWTATKRKAGKLGKAAVPVGTGELPEKTILPQTMGVILLLPPHCPRVLLDQIFTIWMEDFGVSHVGLGISSACASYDQSLKTPWKTSCTVDLGWSSTLIVPTFKNKPITVPKKEEKPTPVSTIRRMPFGGRHMVNMMKYYMSYRQYNLMDQEHLLRDVFERLSYISTNMDEELNIARLKSSGRRPYDRDFVLPDFQNTMRGEIRIPLALQRDIEREEQKKKENEEDDDEDEEDDEDFNSDDEEQEDDEMEDENFDEEENEAPKKAKKNAKDKKKKKPVEEEENEDSDEEESLEEKRKRLLRERAEEERRRREKEAEEQVLRVSVERFTIPEVLFRPIDAGFQSDLVGLPRAIVQSVEACPECYRPALYKSVYLVGGVALLPNLIDRLKSELRSLVPSEYEVEVSMGESPIDRAWQGAKSYFEKENYANCTVSRQEWEEKLKRKAYSKLLVENGGCYV